MINRLIPPLSSPVPGATQTRANKQAGIPDFGALLDIPPVVEGMQFGPGGGHPRKQGAQLDDKKPGLPVVTLFPGSAAAAQAQGQGRAIIPGTQPDLLPLPAVQMTARPQQGQLVDPTLPPAALPLSAAPVSSRPPQVPPVNAMSLPSTAPPSAVQMHLRPQIPAVDLILRPVPAPQGILTDASAAGMLGDGASLPNVAAAAAELTQSVHPIEQPTDTGSEWVSRATTPNLTPEIDHTNAGTIGERIELVSMPWRLQANAGLSYRTVAIDAPDAASGLREQAPVQSGTNPTTHGQLFTFAPLLEGGSIADWLDSLQPFAGSSDRDRSIADLTSPNEVADHAPVETMASLIWPERLLRWLADSDGKGTTAWVRDYQIDPSQAARMIDSLRSLAEQQGLHLHRVMFNGHELWRSASTPDITPRGQ